MKKKAVTLFAAMLTIMSVAFANSTKPSSQIQNEFNHHFTKATDVNWNTESNFYVATFQQGGAYLTAYFNPTGQLESVSRNITINNLPLVLQKRLQDKMERSWVSESFEIAGPNGTGYYVTVENAATKTVYHATSNDWAIYKTTKK